MKKERLEDLGRIYEKLNFLIIDIEQDWGRFCTSKHDYEDFYIAYSLNMSDLHSSLYALILDLQHIRNIAYGDIE